MILCCLLTLPVAAQETKVVRDLALWSGVAIEKKVHKDWTFSLEQEFRIGEDISTLRNSITEAGVRYRINRNFALQTNYRYNRHRINEGSFKPRTRYNFDLRYKGRLDFITLAYRARYQKEVEGMNLLDPHTGYKKYLRHKLTLSYSDLKQLKPYAYAELFRLYRMYKPARYDYYRVVAGVSYTPGKIGKVDLSYGFNHEFNTTLPATLFMFRLYYTYSF